jgi:hypothetical protein
MLDKVIEKVKGNKAPITDKSVSKGSHTSETAQAQQISDADLLKYTGKNRAELNDWAKNQPGVAGNQAAGKLAMGPASGVGGYETSQGYGGWGWNSNAEPKFPPQSSGGNDKEVRDDTEMEERRDK